MSGRERIDLLIGKLDKVLGLTGKDDPSALIECIVKWPYSDGIPCSDPFIVSAVIDYKSKFGIQHLKASDTVFKIQRQQYLTITVALKGITLLLKFFS